ncbi:MAG: type II toxin-antitoxin system Phd/YefM family antitoxin [Gemmatimonadota bacterium]|nr:type II toxin-antitoxin system Phd/YefM family antitoxin [Gemmatimonadota bacterium]
MNERSVRPSKKTTARLTASTPARTVPAGEFKATCLELMDEVKQRHVEFIVTKRGEPVAKLAPVDATPPSPFGYLRGTVIEEHDLVAPDHVAWTASNADPLSKR